MQAALHELVQHGILNKRTIKVDKFREEYLDKLMKGSDKNVSYKEKETSTELYYFNVDIKFILKARLHQLDEVHTKNENNAKNQ